MKAEIELLGKRVDPLEIEELDRVLKANSRKSPRVLQTNLKRERP